MENLIEFEDLNMARGLIMSRVAKRAPNVIKLRA